MAEFDDGLGHRKIAERIAARRLIGKRRHFGKAEKLCAFARFCDPAGRVWNLVGRSDEPDARRLTEQESAGEVKVEVKFCVTPASNVIGPITALPGVGPLCADRKIAEGLDTSFRPLSVMPNTPSSLTARRASAPQERPQGASPALQSLGLAVAELGEAQKRELKVKGGVRVESATEAAARAGLREGDVIVAVANTEVANLREFEAALARLEPGCFMSVNVSSSTLTRAAYALATIVLVGMQPSLTQVPPRCSRSTSATFQPAATRRAIIPWRAQPVRQTRPSACRARWARGPR